MTPTTPTPPPKPAADPFAIGWREVTRRLPDGSTVVEQEPLTLADALHPQEGDTIVQNTVHDRDWAYLRDVIRSRVAGDPTALVLADTKVLWEDGVHHSPDVAVIFGVADPHRPRSQFDVAAEGVRPRLIVEVVSPATRHNDVETKVEHYHRYRVQLYVIVDREGEDDSPRLIGYQRRPRQYAKLPPEDGGRLWLEPIGVYLGVRDGRVVAYDGDTGEELGDYTAVSAALEAEQARAAEAETRAEAERQRADAEKQRADAAEARLRQLEAALRTSQPPTAPPGP
jgi:Uma2 family endonuclease